MIMRPAGQPKESYGDRSFQGIGKTTREAKQAAAKAALTKLRATMPGIKFAPGVIPFEWSDWCRKNLKRGALLEDLLKTLTTKGFHPAKNPGFMEKFLLIRSWAYAFGEPFPPQEKVKPEPVYPEIVSRVQFDDGVVDRVRKDFDQSKKLSTVPEHVEARSRRFEGLRRLHAIFMNRFYQTRSLRVSESARSPRRRRRDAPRRSGSTCGWPRAMMVVSSWKRWTGSNTPSTAYRTSSDGYDAMKVDCVRTSCARSRLIFNFCVEMIGGGRPSCIYVPARTRIKAWSSAIVAWRGRLCSSRRKAVV